jgi:16S rRNA (guanine527-N7)-methyltransferase
VTAAVTPPGLVDFAPAGPIEPGRAGFAAALGVSRETLARFDQFHALLVAGHARTNLLARSTLDEIWLRHFADSAQLLGLAPDAARWVDMGAGAGFPGVVLALLGARVDLVEPRRLRAEFLRHAVDELGLAPRARVHQARAERLDLPPADAVTARAVAALPILFDWGRRFAAMETRFVFPRGSAAAQELMHVRTIFEIAQAQLVPSRTAAGSAIVVARGVQPRASVVRP